MEEQVQILQLSSLSKEDILKEVLQLLNHSEIQKFTIMVKRLPLASQTKKMEFSYSAEETGITISGVRGKSSTIDRYYRSSNFGQKSFSLFQEDDQASQANSILPDSPKELGIKLYRDGAFAEAIQILEQLRQQFPRQNREQSFKKQYSQILAFLANSYYRSKDYSKAINIYKEVLADCSTIDEKSLGQLYNNLGCCYAKVGSEKLSMTSYAQAIKYYGKFKEMDCSLLLANIANIYSSCGMFGVAEKYYFDAINERKSKMPKKKEMLDQIYRKLSLVQEKMNKFGEALDSLGRALEIAQQGYGNVIEILFQRARVKEELERWTEALEDYQKIHYFYQSQGRNKGLIYQKAFRIHERLGKQSECAKYVLLAIQQYKSQGNVRKVSELSSHRFCRGIAV